MYCQLGVTSAVLTILMPVTVVVLYSVKDWLAAEVTRAKNLIAKSSVLMETMAERALEKGILISTCSIQKYSSDARYVLIPMSPAVVVSTG